MIDKAWLAQKLFDKYSLSAKVLFFIFLTGVLSAGRSFSIIHINLGPLPVFITEIILFLCFPLIIFHSEKIRCLPKKFFIFIAVYFSLGCIYLAWGLLNKNLFALRDITLFLYILFLPLTCIILSDKKAMRLFLLVLVAGNVAGLIAGRFLILDVYPSEAIRSFIIKTKTFNLGLYYGITSVFMIAFWNELKSKAGKLALLTLIAVNLYMIVIFANRALWLSFIIVFLYLFFILKRKFFRCLTFLLPILVGVIVVLGYFDLAINANDKMSRVSSKSKSLEIFFAHLKHSQVQALSETHRKLPDNIIFQPQTKSGFDSILWRLGIWHKSIKFGLESPIWGRGFGVYPPYKMWGRRSIPQRVGVDSGVIPAHNHLITVFYKMGFLGLGLFLFINIYVLRYGLIYVKNCKIKFFKLFLIAALGAFIVWNITALFFDLINSPSTSIFLWIIMGLIFAAVEADKKLLVETDKEGEANGA